MKTTPAAWYRWPAIASLAVLFAVGPPRGAESAERFTSSATLVPLVELYTSEGCSSCPPADRWLAGFRDDAGLWSRIVPVAFHVDYWDEIGWPDRFASPFYSLRQRRYAEAGLLSQVYTPGVLVSGREWTGWADRQALPIDGSRRPGVLLVEMLDTVRAHVEFRPEGSVAERIDVSIALLGFAMETDVMAGENAGEHLVHDFVVLGLVEVPLQRQGRLFATDVELPPLSQPALRRGVAAWVSASGSPLPLQAVGGWLRK